MIIVKEVHEISINWSVKTALGFVVRF